MKRIAIVLVAALVAAVSPADAGAGYGTQSRLLSSPKLGKGYTGSILYWRFESTWAEQDISSDAFQITCIGASRLKVNRKKTKRTLSTEFGCGSLTFVHDDVTGDGSLTGTLPSFAVITVQRKDSGGRWRTDDTTVIQERIVVRLAWGRPELPDAAATPYVSNPDPTQAEFAGVFADTTHDLRLRGELLFKGLDHERTLKGTEVATLKRSTAGVVAP